MIGYGAPPLKPGEFEQPTLPGFSQGGEQLMDEARRWRMVHRLGAWAWYKDLARRECERSPDGKASPNYCLQAMRREFALSVPNAYAPALARIAMEEEPALRFRVARSRCDCYTTARL